MLVGGGLGRAPVIGQVIREFLPLADLLAYLEAILRVYNRHGRRDNIHKARIKVLVKSLGIERFREQVEAEWRGRARQRAAPAPPRKSSACARASRRRPTRTCPTSTSPAAASCAFRPGIATTRAPTRCPATARCSSRSRRTGEPGDMTSEQMEAVAALADRVSFGLVRATHDQNLLLADVRQRELYALWQELERLRPRRRPTSAR